MLERDSFYPVFPIFPWSLFLLFLLLVLPLLFLHLETEVGGPDIPLSLPALICGDLICEITHVRAIDHMNCYSSHGESCVICVFYQCFFLQRIAIVIIYRVPSLLPGMLIFFLMLLLGWNNLDLQKSHKECSVPMYPFTRCQFSLMWPSLPRTSMLSRGGDRPAPGPYKALPRPQGWVN